MNAHSALPRSDIAVKLEKIFQLDAGSQHDRTPSILAIGYGNAARGDDIIGSEIVNLIRSLKIKNVEVCSLEELKPELSTKLAKFDYAIFIKACQMNRPQVKVRNLQACGLETAGSSVPGWGHSWLPCSLLALTHSVYGRHPQSWWVQVAARDFLSGHPLSDRAKQSIQTAVEQITSLIYQCISGCLVPIDSSRFDRRL